MSFIRKRRHYHSAIAQLNWDEVNQHRKRVHMPCTFGTHFTRYWGSNHSSVDVPDLLSKFIVKICLHTIKQLSCKSPIYKLLHEMTSYWMGRSRVQYDVIKRINLDIGEAETR